MARLQISLWVLVVSCTPNGSGAQPGLEALMTTREAAPSTSDAGLMSASKLDAWLRYQKQLLGKPLLDAGLAPLNAMGRARRERALRVDAGLSEDEVDFIEDLVAAIVTERNLAKLTGVEAMRDFEQAAVALTPSQKAQTAKALAGVRARAAQATSLEAQKTRFGAANVEAALARESELTKTYDAMVEGR